MEWLMENHFSFTELKTIRFGMIYAVTINEDMELWATNKLNELGILHKFTVSRCAICNCECHKGLTMHFMECCDNGIRFLPV